MSSCTKDDQELDGDDCGKTNQERPASEFGWGCAEAEVHQQRREANVHEHPTANEVGQNRGNGHAAPDNGEQSVAPRMTRRRY
jgi:hypothetical protein